MEESSEVLQMAFRQRWYCGTNAIWDDTQQSSKAFLESPFGKTFKAQKKTQQKFLAEGNTNEWDLPMFTNILLNGPIPSSSYQFIEIVRNVRKFLGSIAHEVHRRDQFRTKRMDDFVYRCWSDQEPRWRRTPMSFCGQREEGKLEEKIFIATNLSLFRPNEKTSAGYCSCGVHTDKAPGKSFPGQPSISFCPNKNKLAKHIYSPWLSLLCHEDEPHKVSSEKTKHFIAPHGRWFSMGQIVRISEFLRLILFIRTKFDEEVAVHFCLDKDRVPKTFSFQDAKVGHTIVIMDAERHDFFDGSTGIRQEDPDGVAIFSCSMNELIETFARVSNSSPCFPCGLSSPANQSLQQCGKCRVAMYCGKECQTKRSMGAQKKTCPSMKYLQQ